MRKSLIAGLCFVLVAAPATAQEIAANAVTPVSARSISGPQVAVERGQMVVATNGARLGRVVRVAADGSPQVIFEGAVLTVPVSSLAEQDGRLVTNLSIAELTAD